MPFASTASTEVLSGARRRLFLCWVLAVSLPTFAADDATFEVSIAEQPLGAALQSLATQLEVQIVFFSGATRALSSPPLEGQYTRRQALEAILSGTGLGYVFLNENSVAIRPPPEPERAAAPAEAPVAPFERHEVTRGNDPPEPAGEFGMDEIVVTGTASRVRTKFDSSVAISTYDRGDIARQSPSSTADLVSAVPGFWVESTSGTTHGNVFARGIVQDGGYRYVGLVEDGLPVYPVFELSFYNPDQFIRVSESTERVEVVRGGTAPIFTSGAVGGTINFINEPPPAQPEVRIKTAVSDFGSRLLDVYWGAPLSDTWRLSAGGWLRRSDGVRDPGYDADRGGEMRIDLERISADSRVSLYAKRIDDRSLFVVPIPLRGNPSNPVAVDGTAAGEYSLHSADIRAAGLPPSAAEVGLEDADLADGIHPSLLTAGVRLDRRWASGAWLASHTRYTDGDVSFDGIFTGDVPVTGAGFAAARGVDPDFTYITGGAELDPDFLVQNHGHWAVLKGYRALQNETKLTVSLGPHELTAGVYGADFSMADRWSLGNLLLTDVGDRPQRLFLPGVTDAQGFTRYSFLNLRADYDGIAAALFASDEWRVDERLRVDAGLRYDHQWLDAAISEGMEDVDLDADPATTYDVAALAGPEGDVLSADFDHLSYSLGFNYDFRQDQAWFGHFTRSAKLPHFDDLRNGVTTRDRVTNAELGYKASLDTLALFLTLYLTEFDNVPFTDILVDGSTVVRRAETRTYGVELEGVYEPIDTVTMQFSATLQDPEYRNFSGISVDNSGNRVRRVPRSMIRLVPSISFAAGRGRAFLTLAHYGVRYANDENTIRLPSYLKIDAGVEYRFGEAWSTQLNVDNLSNEVGLTEGNPRTDVGASGIGQIYNARTLFGRSLTLAVRYRFQPG
ncbi:MAG TPA: TonB-dependent receptor [Woeseiaceae bacterium]|nr:TonB-dependent receptor [Woeseiaceae bacterium]